MAERMYRYTVRGAGDFPWDMLRYDRVWPLTAPVPHRTEGKDTWSTVRTIDVMGYGCTPGRWGSFWWTVMNEDNAVLGID
jgi:hypothetical protein